MVQFLHKILRSTIPLKLQCAAGDFFIFSMITPHQKNEKRKLEFIKHKVVIYICKLIKFQ